VADVDDESHVVVLSRSARPWIAATPLPRRRHALTTLAVPIRNAFAAGSAISATPPTQFSVATCGSRTSTPIPGERPEKLRNLRIVTEAELCQLRVGQAVPVPDPNYVSKT
jgi:hypothetical protein